MCDPITIATMTASIGSYLQEEQGKSGNRKMAGHSLAVQSQGVVTKDTEQQLAYQKDQDNFRRQAAVDKGTMLAIGAKRGTTYSSALEQTLNEYGARENDLHESNRNRRHGEMLAMNVDQANLDSEWQTRMMQNKSGGLLGLGLSGLSGWVQGKAMQA